jgi:ATP-dependent DNA ligase
LKLDGYRLLGWIDHGRARLVTRNGHDWTPPAGSRRGIGALALGFYDPRGRLRHPVFLGLREDKPATDVIMAVPNPDAVRREAKPLGIVVKKTASPSRWKGAMPPLRATAR